MSVAFIDIETTGLDPRRHDTWEVAVLVDGGEYVARIQPDLITAEPAALRLNRFYDRCGSGDWVWDDPDDVALEVAALTSGRHIVGAAPWFDAGFLDELLRSHGQAPAWHHRLICVETLAAGAYGWPLPKSLSDTAEALGIAVDDGAAHTALEDARTARAVYHHVLALHDKELPA